MYSAEPPYPLGTFIYRDSLKPHLQESIPGAHVEIINRHKQGIIEATCTINDQTYNITLTRVSGGYACHIKTLTTTGETDTEAEEETHTTNHNKIINALTQLLNQ